MLKDILVTFECPSTFTVRASIPKREYEYQHEVFVRTDNETVLDKCEVIEPIMEQVLPMSAKLNVTEQSKQFKTLMTNFHTKVNDINEQSSDSTFATSESAYTAWYRVEFTLFSMLVSASFFAAYNITTFYTAVVFTAGGAIRVALIFSTF